jgi:hypothetical protein
MCVLYVANFPTTGILHMCACTTVHRYACIYIYEHGILYQNTHIHALEDGNRANAATSHRGWLQHSYRNMRYFITCINHNTCMLAGFRSMTSEACYDARLTHTTQTSTSLLVDSCVTQGHACVTQGHACVTQGHACVTQGHACVTQGHACDTQGHGHGHDEETGILHSDKRTREL